MRDFPDDPLSFGLRRGAGAYKDTRDDLGYGRNSNHFHKPRSKGEAFPYANVKDEEVIEDEEVMSDEDLQKFINKIATPYKSSDSLIKRSRDSMYKAGGNKPVGPSLGEQAGKGLAPFPAMYKKRIQVGGGVNSPMAIDPGQYPRTGTKRGWSLAPEEPALDAANITYSEYESGEDPNLIKLRKVIRYILDQENEAE